MIDEQKDLFDACIKQAEYFHNHFDQRRQYEWKITLAVWTLFVGGIAFVHHPLSVSPWLAGVLLVGYTLLWLKRVWEANNTDKELSMYYQRQADCVMRDALYQIEPRPPYKQRPFYNLSFFTDWSVIFQFMATLILAILFYKIQR
jgi:hypothetical protein